MSGTSLDGLDIAYCSFTYKTSWCYKIIAFKTVSYSDSYREKLRNATSLSTQQLSEFSTEFGSFMAQKVAYFINENSIVKMDLIASHGHTVFHQPDKGITLQIGKPKPLYDQFSVPVVYDFRVQDVKLGGQGAPLVPFVDQVLFGEFNACLNLGGFSNISFDLEGRRVAFDICPVNIVLNLWANKVELEYDNEGVLARSGVIDQQLLEQLNGLNYYKTTCPKSLGWEWVEQFVLPLLIRSKVSIANVLRTYTEHAAQQMAHSLSQYQIQTVLLTGGGVYNSFLLERMQALVSSTSFQIEPNIVNSKEAMAFAFLGLKRLLNQINVLSSVTGSVKDHCSGRLYLKEL
tara:strand:- start:178 stop:1215 length:1038 start_codon:yes stop_codon:yes gene_type:complete